jgi:hypothetical protein
MKQLLPLFFLFVAMNLSAQDVYYTRGATLHLNGELNGQPLQLKTNKLIIRLDYETATAIMRLRVSDLQCDVDSLQKLLRHSPTEFVYEAKLSLDYISTEKHPPMEFTLEGWLSHNGLKTWVSGDGELHFNANAAEYTNLMGLTFRLNLRALGIEPPVPGLAEDFEAVVVQALLQKDKN